MKQRLIALLYVLTFAPAALEKFISVETPKWFLDQFQPTLLGAVPQLLPLQFYGIAVLEGFAAVLMMISVFKSSSEQVFRFGLVIAFLIFTALSFGQRLSHKFDSAAELFVYAAITFFVYQSFFSGESKPA